jgi:hypothetical protein
MDMIAEMILRAGIGLCPTPALHTYRGPSCRCLTGTRGSNFSHDAFDTVHDLIGAVLYGIFAQFAPLAAGPFPKRIKLNVIYE